eukprot:647121-Rhodomonas_salina.1
MLPSSPRGRQCPDRVFAYYPSLLRVSEKLPASEPRKLTRKCSTATAPLALRAGLACCPGRDLEARKDTEGGELELEADSEHAADHRMVNGYHRKTARMAYFNLELAIAI